MSLCEVMTETQLSTTQFYTLYYYFTACPAPTARIYIYNAHLDLNSKVELDFMDPNQPSVVTGYNVTAPQLHPARGP